jgi:hypothetical protein
MAAASRALLASAGTDRTAADPAAMLISAGRPPAKAVHRHLPPALEQFLVVAGCAAVAIMLSLVHLAAVGRPLFVLMALAAALRYLRRSPWEYLTISMWFWSLSPFVRRVTDYYGGFQPGSVVLITPSLLSLLMVRDILSSQGLLTRRESAIGLIGLVPVVYGLCASFVQGQIVPGVISAADWFTPLFYYFYMLHLAPRIQEGEPAFRSFVPLNMLVVGGYGLWQYFNPPLWDVAWVLNTGFTTQGVPVAYGLKPFSTLNDCGLDAVWLGALILLSLRFRSRLSLLMLAPATLLLALTQVRGVIGGTVLGLCLAAVLGRGKMIRSMLLFATAAVAMLGLVAVLDPRVGTSLMARFSTVGSLQSDESARVRALIWASAPAIIDELPFGLGIGALGHGAVASNNTSMVSVDAGPVAIYIALGWIAGSIYLAGFLAVTAQAVLAASSTRSPTAIAFAAVALGGAAVLLFVNPVGLQGMTIWFAAGYASAIEMNARLRRSPDPAQAKRRSVGLGHGHY